MGTSRNDPSPRVPPWRPALAALGNVLVPPRRQLAEVWRAATAERGDPLLRALTHPALPDAVSAAIAQKQQPTAALDAFEATRVKAQASGLPFDLARRAALRSAVHGLDLQHAAAEFLAEVTDYFVSRDLPSFIGAAGRVRDVGAGESLRHTLRDLTRRASAAEVSLTDARSWRTHVEAVVERLKKL